MTSFSGEDSRFLAYLRSLSILVIVFGHIGVFWLYKPWSEFLHVFIPVFFFISGAVSYGSYCRSAKLSDYYKKRCIALLIPYYLLVMVQFLVFICVNFGIHNLTISDLIRWILITPNNTIMPFAIGHVWFLHTLFVLFLVSPFYFHLFRMNKKYLFLIVFFSLLMSFAQMFVDININMILFHNNLFKPVVHSCFFLFGVLVFHADFCRKSGELIFLLISSLLLAVVLAKWLRINIDYDFHTYAPDLYYVAGSFAAIAVMLLCEKLLINLVQFFSLKTFFFFLHRHTYSIYLVHAPVLSLWFYLFAPGGSVEKNLSYGLLKMVFVVIGTIVCAIPFTYLTSLAMRKANNFLERVW